MKKNGKIKFDPRNARRHGDTNKAMIRESLQEVGAFRSIALDGNNIVRAGNGVYEQAQALGYKVKVIDAKPNELIAVRRPDLKGKKAIRAALYDNRTGELSEWDADILSEMAAQDKELLAGIFDDKALAEFAVEILPEETDDEHAGELVDKAEELQKRWRVKRGDIWQIGEHFIICGDCMEADVIKKLLGDIKPHLLLTDPNYGIKITRKSNNYGDSPHRSRKANNENWDDKPPSIDDIKFLMQFAVNQIFFGANYFWEAFYASQCYIVWDKRGDLPDVPFAPTEFAWTSFVDRPSKKYVVINHGFIREEKTTEFHPTQKPVVLFEKIINDFSESGDFIFDPFLGSGTTICAAHRNNRRGLGIEKLEKYVAVCLERLQTITEQKPKLFKK